MLPGPSDSGAGVDSDMPHVKWFRNEQNRFFRGVRESSTQDEAIVGLMLHAGLRIGEVCTLSRGDLHIGERAGKVTVRQGKGNKYREVPLNVTIRKMAGRES